MASHDMLLLVYEYQSETTTAHRTKTLIDNLVIEFWLSNITEHSVLYGPYRVDYIRQWNE